MTTTFHKIDGDEPATLSEVIAAVERLSKLDETEMQEAFTNEGSAAVFPFRVKSTESLGPDFQSAQDIIRASPIPLSAKRRGKPLEIGIVEIETAAGLIIDRELAVEVKPVVDEQLKVVWIPHGYVGERIQAAQASKFSTGRVREDARGSKTLWDKIKEPFKSYGDD